MFVGMIAVLKTADPALIAATILLFTFWFLKTPLRNVWMIRNIPGPRGIPILGNLNLGIGLNSEQMHNKFCELNKTYGPIIAFRALTKIIVTVSCPIDAKIIMMNPKLRNRDPLVELLTNTFIENSFFSMRDNEWTARRKLVNTAFGFQIVVQYLETFAKKADELAAKLALVADGRSVDILRDMSLCTLSGFLETAVGYKNEMNGEEINSIMERFDATMASVSNRIVTPTHWPLWAYNLSTAGKAAKKNSEEMFDFVDTMIEAILETKKQDNAKDNSVSATGAKKLQTYTEVVMANASGTKLVIPIDHMRGDLIILAGGGTETCASTMSLFLMLTSINNEYQERLLEEQRTVFGDSLRPVRNEDLLEMPFLDMCVKETLRLFPPIPINSRSISFDLPISKGRTLPAGTLVLFNAFNVHRNPLNFVDPDKFWPERWLPENSVNRHSHAYMPYGGGNRNCVAVRYSQFQMKATLSRLLRQFQFSCDNTMEDLNRLEYRIFNRVVVGYNLRMVPRAAA